MVCQFFIPFFFFFSANTPCLARPYFVHPLSNWWAFGWILPCLVIAFGIVWILFKEILGETGKGWLPMPSWCISGRGGLRLARGLQCLEPSPTPSSELFRPLCFADYSFLSQLFGLRISKSQYSVLQADFAFWKPYSSDPGARKGWACPVLGTLPAWSLCSVFYNHFRIDTMCNTRVCRV